MRLNHYPIDILKGYGLKGYNGQIIILRQRRFHPVPRLNRIANGKQNFLRFSCKKNFQQEHVNKFCFQQQIKQVLKMLIMNCGLRDIAFII